jgi:hypothetical protein
MGFFTSILGQISFPEYAPSRLRNWATAHLVGARAEIQGGEGFDVAPTDRRASFLATAEEGGEAEAEQNQRKASGCGRRRL